MTSVSQTNPASPSDTGSAVASLSASRATKRRSKRRFVTALLVLTGIAMGASSVLLNRLEADALAEVEQAPTKEELPAARTAHVLQSVRSLKLVTVEVTTHVASASSEESWRGDVKATVDAPVKLHFGTDLSRIPDSGLRFGSLGGTCVVVVPPPERIATEVFGEQETTDVHVGWFRSRGLSGEKHLGQARRDLYGAARSLQLSADDNQRVRAQTREQVANLVRSIVGPTTWVTVKFEDENDLTMR